MIKHPIVVCYQTYVFFRFSSCHVTRVDAEAELMTSKRHGAAKKVNISVTNATDAF